MLSTLIVLLRAIRSEPSSSRELPRASAVKLPADNVPTVILLPVSITIDPLPALIELATVNQSVVAAPS